MSLKLSWVKYYVGSDKPKFQYPSEPEHFEGKMYPEWQLKNEADNLPESPEQAGWDKMHEDEDGN